MPEPLPNRDGLVVGWVRDGDLPSEALLSHVPAPACPPPDLTMEALRQVYEALEFDEPEVRVSPFVPDSVGAVVLRHGAPWALGQLSLPVVLLSPAAAAVVRERWPSLAERYWL